RVIRGNLQNLSVDAAGRMFLSEPDQPPLDLQVLAVREPDDVGARIETLSSLAHAAPPFCWTGVIRRYGLLGFGTYAASACSAVMTPLWISRSTARLSIVN